MAATKTFVTSLSRLAASRRPAWAGLDDLRAAIERLPDRLAAATRLDWSRALTRLCEATSLVSHRTRTDARNRARGGAEAEGDLRTFTPKHSAAPSSGTVRSPWSRRTIPFCVFMPTDQAAAGLRALAADLRRKNARVFMTDYGRRTRRRPAHAGARSSRRGRRVPDPELLRPGHSAGATSWHRCRPAAAPAEGHAHQMSRPARHAIAADHVFDGTRRARACRRRRRRRPHRRA